MSQLSLSDLEQFPQSAIQISDGLVCGVNHAASALLPSLRQGCPPPAPLLPLLDEGTQPVGTVALSHTLFTYSRLPLEKGILLLLQPAPAQGVTPRQLDGFIRQARTLMQDLLLTVQLMESSSGEASRPDFWKTYCRTTRLLSNLQFMAQAAEEGVPFHPVTLDLAGLVRQTAAEAASLLELSHLSLDYHELPSSLLIPGDPALLRKLLLTLLSNGARATPPGGQLTVSLRQSPSRALLLVTDGGNSQPDWQTLFPSPAPSPMPAAPQDGAGHRAAHCGAAQRNHAPPARGAARAVLGCLPAHRSLESSSVCPQSPARGIRRPVPGSHGTFRRSSLRRFFRSGIIKLRSAQGAPQFFMLSISTSQRWWQHPCRRRCTGWPGPSWPRPASAAHGAG